MIRPLLILLLTALSASVHAATQISLVATQITLPAPFTYSTDSDSPEGAWVVPLDSVTSISATVTLAQTLAPGNYSVFVKVLDYDRANSNLVVLGTKTFPLNVFNDRDVTTGYWSTNVTATISADTSTFIVRFYRGGGGSAHAVRWLATYITSDTNEIVLRDDRAITFLFTNAVDTGVTPGNLVPNSSFEGGISRFWRVITGNDVVPPRTFTLQDCLETGFGFHGQQCLRIQTRTDSSIFSVQSNPILCGSNRLHSFSAYAKCSAGANLFNLYIVSLYTAPSGYTATFSTNTSTTLSTSWQRVTLTNVFLPWYPNGQYYLIMETRGGAGGGTYTYVDAVQLEEGATPTAYAPMNAFEVGGTLSERTQVISIEDEPTVELRAFNNGSSTATKQVISRIYDWTNSLVISFTNNLTATASNFTSTTIDVPVDKKGHFRLITSITNQPWDSELTWAVVRPELTTADTNSFFGVHANADTNTLWRLQRLGVKYQRGLSLGRVRWSETELTPGAFTWPDTATDMALYTNVGITVMLNLGENNPAWMTNFWENTNGSYARFCTNAIDHYRGLVGAVELWNEPNQDQTEVPNLGHYAVLVNQAADAIKAFNPSIQVIAGGGLSTYQMVTNVIALCGSHTNHIDAFSVHLYPPNEYSAADFWGFRNFPIINSETGYPDKGGYIGPDFPFRTAGHMVVPWKSADPFYDATWNSLEAQAKNLLTCLGYGLSRYYYYDGGQRNIQPRDIEEVQYTTQDYDDSPKPKAAMLSGVFGLVDKAVGKGAWTFGDATAFGYLRGSVPVAAVWANSNRLATFSTITTNDIKVYDVMGNGITPSSLAIPLGVMPLLIEGQGGLSLATLSNAVRNAVVIPRLDLRAPTLVKTFVAKSHRAVDSYRWFALDDLGVPNEDSPDRIKYRYQVNGGAWSDWGQQTSLELVSGSLATIEVQARDLAGNIASTISEGGGSGSVTNPPVLGGPVKIKGKMRIRK